MTLWLKQSTAVTVLVGPFVDSTDGVTAETALTITQAEVRLSKNGGDMAQKGDATSLTHDEIGYYTCPLSTTDTNTLGVLKLMIAESGALPVWIDFMVVPANVWDSLFGADLLDISVTQWIGTACHAAGTAGVPEVAVHDQATVLVDAVWDEAVAGHTTAATFGLYLGGAPTIGSTLSADVTNIHTDLGTAITAIGDVHATDLPDLHTDVADLHTDLATAITAIGDVHATDLPAVKTVVDAILVDTGTTLETDIDAILADTNELQTDWHDGGRLDLLLDAAGGAGTPPTAAEVADAVWDEVATGHTTTGKAGEQLWTDVDAILVDTGTTLETDIDAILADTNELQTDWHNGGRLDLILDAAGASAGTGAITWVYTLTSSVDNSPIAEAQVWVTTDSAGANVIASGTTSTLGKVTFYLDAGTYYYWRAKSGWNFTNPDIETIA